MDLISRQAVLSLLDSYVNGSIYFGYENVENFKVKINKLPPINPQEPKIGHWIEHNAKTYECSECHNNKSLYASYKTDYCPDCGARMESEDKDASSN